MVLKYYSDIEDALLSDLLIQDNIKNEKQLMASSDSTWKYFPETDRSTGVYIILYICGPIDHGTHVPVPVSQ